MSNLADTKAAANGQVAAYLPGGVGLPSDALDDELHESTVEARGYWAGVWLRLKRDKLALAGAVFIVLLFSSPSPARRSPRSSSGTGRTSRSSSRAGSTRISSRRAR